MSTIKVGDRVKISETPDLERYGSNLRPYWMPDMDKHKGQVGTVERFGPNGYPGITFGDDQVWYFLLDDLTPVPALKIGDRVLITSSLDSANYKDDWAPEMAGFAGKVGVVESTARPGAASVRVAELGDWWSFKAADLTVVPEIPEANLPTGHVHAASMLLYAQDAAETAKPWLRWEFNEPVMIAPWVEADEHPRWEFGMVYRRKPLTIRIGGFDVPEPLRVAPVVGTRYFVPEIESRFEKLSGFSNWDGDELDQRWLARGLVHLTEEAAALHAKALLSFSTVG